MAIITAAMADISLTAQQRRAVTTVDTSVIVSAAAGSGKTAVLAERCAYLVCDAPEGKRCEVDELLVLTFTDAAAAEMRSRIVEAIRKRVEQQPDNPRLRRQLALTDAAQISTIHSFCNWIIRRWFSELGLDPATGLLDAEEAALLRRDTLDALFESLYDARRRPKDPLGRDAVDLVDRQAEASVSSPGLSGDGGADPGTGTSAENDSLAKRFERLITDYGLGSDIAIADLIRKLRDFVSSLVHPDQWLQRCREAVATDGRQTILQFVDSFQGEMQRQIEHGRCVMAVIRAGDAIGHAYAEQIDAYVASLEGWSSRLATADRGKSDSASAAPTLAAYDAVIQEIGAFSFPGKGVPRLKKDTDEATVAARDAARDQRKQVKESLFDKRLRNRYASQSVDELLHGLSRIAPYVATIADLVSEFSQAYSDAKNNLDVMDFGDLERHALNLLMPPDSPDSLSPAAKNLRARFSYILVDEYQDINPIQNEIIRCVTREADAGKSANLFVVGDVKQSIYRFRLAESTIFINRWAVLRSKEHNGEAMTLQKNFRSRVEVLDAVNLLFTQLMPASATAGAVVYDDDAVLHLGRDPDADAVRHPVELHLLERQWSADVEEQEPSGGRALGTDDPAQWSAMQREAFAIGTRIRELRESGELQPGGKPLAFGDIAVLLRATKVNAEHVAGMLTAMGIPAYAELQGGLFGALEVRDVLAALSLLDNADQDIQLASVMRSGILCAPFSEDELVEMRTLDRDVPFFQAVRAYADGGSNTNLRDRLANMFARIDRFRAEFQHRPIAAAIWRLYQQHGYLAHVCGLPNGAQRRANLIKLHEVARKFGTFRKQGLHRFLSFVKSLQDNDNDLGAAPSVAESEDVVHILSIHKSKGLEFPVVFLAGLGNNLNLQDRSGRMIFERVAGIGLRVVDQQARIEYPSVAHRLVVDEIERQTREEELRVLYVAMTRARDKLVLVGTTKDAVGLARLDARSEAHPLSLHILASATNRLDWILPALASAPAGTVAASNDRTTNGAVVTLFAHDLSEMRSWRTASTARDQDNGKQFVSRGEPLPKQEPLAPDHPDVASVLDRISFVYPNLEVASAPVVVAATGLADAESPAVLFDADLMDRTPVEDADVGFESSGGADASLAASRGSATHRLLEHLDFASTATAEQLDRELQRLTQAGTITAEQAAVIDRPGVEWFLGTPLADAIRAAGDKYRREFQFLATISPSRFDPTLASDTDERMLVRGMVDGILPVGDELVIIDYKTDRLTAGQLEARTAKYRSQMDIYTTAMSDIWRRRVKASKLVFLSLREIVTLEANSPAD